MTEKIVFAGGGTGGHIYPGLAVADELKKIAEKNNRKIKIYWFGNSGGMDRKLVEKSGIADVFCGIPSGKLRRYFSIKNFFDFFKILAGIFVSFFRLLFIRPSLVFSKGGFVSVPPCFAAWILRIPIFTHECDFTPGLATKINSRFAAKILVSYPETVKFLPKNRQARAVVSGNPVRPAFYEADAGRGREFLSGNKEWVPSKPVLLVLGGSLGARQLNELVVQNLSWLTERFIVVHQCGAKDASFVPERSNCYFPYPFIYEQMPHVIDYADVVISRAGANSIWECTVLKKPMILIPLCGSGTRGDQVDNADFFERKGAAIVLKGEYANSNSLKNALVTMIDAKKRRLFSNACQELIPKERSAYLIARLLADEFITK